MARNRVGIKGNNRRRIQRRDQDSGESDEEYKVTDDEAFDESDECYSLTGDESEEISADFVKSRRASRSRNTWRTSSGKKVNKIMKPRKKRRVSYIEDDNDDEEVSDEDDEEFMSLDREDIHLNKPIEKTKVAYANGDDDGVGGGGRGSGSGGDVGEDYKEFAYSGRNRKQRKKSREKKRVVYIEEDEDDDDDDEAEVADEDTEFMPLGRKAKQIKSPSEMKRVSFAEMDDDDEEVEEDDYAEFVSPGRKRKQRKKPQGKMVLHTEDDGDEDYGNDDDDDEFMYSVREVNQTNRKREISYIEEEEEDDDDSDDDEEDNDDDEDLGFMSTSRKRNQINKRRERRITSYKEDNQEEEDESDAEFKLSESDFVDDEDETPKIKKNQVVRSHRQRKSVRGGRNNNKKSKIKDPIKPKQKNQRFGPKLGCSKKKSVTNKIHIGNQKKISKRRKQRAMADSDSDFVNSESSDHEYTISEEEREQMREARVYCANLGDKPRSSSCGNQEKLPTYEQKKYPIRKGKEKIEDMNADIGKQVCGICLSEEQKRTMRGVLNCCRHYFCFSCIMEWSKVESRCPLCKQRFTTITKAAKSDTGFDLRTVVIPVPECDQVYEPSEEELRGYLDPYESVICTECQNGGDDALMLLCDICDSPAHTFCVGLGREVPEGNWYCEGCRPTVFGTLNSQRVTPNSDRRLNNNTSELSSSSPIAGGFDLNELYVPETPVTQQTRVHPEPNPAPTGTAATTLRDRRRIYRQMHHRFLNNNRMNDLVGRSSGTSAASSGIRLFGSQLDRASVSQTDHIFPPMHDPSTFYPRSDLFSVQVQNSNLASADVALQDEHVALQEFPIGIRTDPPVH